MVSDVPNIPPLELRPHPDPMDVGEDGPAEHENEDMDGSDQDSDDPNSNDPDSGGDDDMGIGNRPLLPPYVIPPLGPRGVMPVVPGRRGPRRGRFNPFQQGERFGGEGHRLGGKEGPGAISRGKWVCPIMGVSNLFLCTQFLITP